jgi:TolA-binding protein
MIQIFTLLLLFGFASEIDFQSARQQFLADVQSYKEVVDVYIAEASKYRNIKMNEEYRQRITNLEKQLTRGNKEVLETVNKYQEKNKDQILLDDVLLMRLAQLEFEKANFDYNENVNKVNSTIEAPDYKKSLEYTTRLLRQYPDSTLADSAEYLIAYIYEEQSDFKKAEAIYSYFLKKYPVSQYYDEVQWRLAELQFENNNIKDARRNYLDLAKRENSKFEFKALYKLGATLFETGLFDWSSKMFVRLYDRLKDDTVSSAERSTLYDETLEYIGLLQRKGISIQLNPEVEALSTKKIQTIFARHGLWKESEKAISDFITKYPNSKHLPDMYARWVDLYEERGQQDRAEEIRTQYFSKLLDNKDWWLANRDNYQERFVAEEQVELNLIASARYLYSKKKWDLAAARYNSFITQYPYDPKSVDAKIELAEIYYSQGKYKTAYSVVADVPVIVMTDSQRDGFFFIQLSSYYALNISAKSSEVKNTMAVMATQYLSNAKNLVRAAGIIKPIAEYLAIGTTAPLALDLLAAYPYDKIEYSTKSVVDLIDTHINIDRRVNRAQTLASLQQKRLEVSLRKLFNLKAYVSADFKITYDDLSFYLSNSDLSRFESASTDLNLKNQSDQNVYALMRAQILRSAGRYSESNAALMEVNIPALKNFSALLQAKNLYDLVDFSGCSKALASIDAIGFKQEYPEYYKLSYDLAWITKGAVAANAPSIALARALASESPIVDHLFRLPSNQKLAYLAKVKGVKGPLMEAVTNKQSCKNIECTYVAWLKAKNQIDIVDDVISAFMPQSDTRWLLAVISDATGSGVLANKADTSENIKNWLQKNQMRFAVSGNHKVLDLLSKWKVPTKDVVIPWDVAMYEWIEWQGGPSITGELQILLQEEKYQDLENKLLLSHQKKSLESGTNLLKYYLFSQNKTKANEVFKTLKDYIDEETYQAMSYVFGFSNEAPSIAQVQNPFITMALAKNDLSNNQAKEAIRRLSSGIKENSNEKMYYYGLLQTLLLLKDEVGASIVAKKAVRNTNSVFAKIADSLLDGTPFIKVNNASIDTMATAILESSPTEPIVDAMRSFVILAKAWLSNTKVNVASIDSFEGWKYLYSANNNADASMVSDPFYSKSLNKIQRGIASEEKK